MFLNGSQVLHYSQEGKYIKIKILRLRDIKYKFIGKEVEKKLLAREEVSIGLTMLNMAHFAWLFFNRKTIMSYLSN